MACKVWDRIQVQGNLRLYNFKLDAGNPGSFNRANNAKPLQGGIIYTKYGVLRIALYSAIILGATQLSRGWDL